MVDPEVSDLPYGMIVAEQNRASFTLLGAGARAAGMGGGFTAIEPTSTHSESSSI